MAKTLKITFQVAPLSGEVQTKTVKVKASATLGEVLEAAGVSATRKKLMVDDEPANLKTRITSDSRITVSEQPQGS